MDMKKRTRKALTYKIRRFFDQLEWKDIVKAWNVIYDNLMILLTIIMLFGIMFFVPHFFH